MSTHQAPRSADALEEASVDHVEPPAFYDIITPRLADLYAELGVKNGAPVDDDATTSPDLQWGQWANWASWTKGM